MDLEITLSFAEITISKIFFGDDLLIAVKGGDKHHIGAAVLAIPRPSLSGDGTASTTSSVLNVTGHKDEVICRILAEKASKKYGVTVVCVGGFHIDDISTVQIGEIVKTIENIDI